MRALTAALLAVAIGAGDGAPRVRLTSPRGGWTGRRVATIAGTVSDRRVRRAELTVNGVSRTVGVRGGRFDVRLPVRPGTNVVEALAAGPGGSGKDAVTFFAQVPPTDLQVVLSWETDGSDLDLYVTEPSGEECYYGHRGTAAGGVLEVDDTDGFGPEVYLLPRAPLGEYRIAVACYDAGRAAVTEARVEVTLREGTPFERRFVFPVAFTHDGETVEVGSVFVDRPLE